MESNQTNRALIKATVIALSVAVVTLGKLRISPVI